MLTNLRNCELHKIYGSSFVLFQEWVGENVGVNGQEGIHYKPNERKYDKKKQRGMGNLPRDC